MDTHDRGETPPFRLEEGATGSPVLLHVPHSARTVPAPVRERILLDDAGLDAELDRMTDSHTALLAERAAVGTGAWRFVNGLSRLVVDPERFPDEREEMRAVGMGAVYTRTSHLTPLREDDAAHEHALLDAWFHPYAAAMTAAVQDRLDAASRAVVIDVHSYPSAPLPYELHGDGPRPPVCLGTDAFHTPPWLSAAAREAFAGCGGIGLDSPFSGTYVPLKHYRATPGVSALMVEIRRDVYMDEPGGAPHAGLDLVAGALATLIGLIEAGPAG
ncbi:N-formylglutamate amidohydrolase [Streptomyces sp. NPDC088354]|uniref:N-formylglutamate amidohydrolase n=1 Tax=unclassified Streptomyces TaxID=2593676 RepID=UPI0029BD6D50|nr:N-formylglutamate amidohydrolase [Streptomyces sp. MI02-7b]MDX3074349.1 N-formylglutamate amidohydrolase [Streptomyces sp. MI02-7b]